jgi:hypothetical protein
MRALTARGVVLHRIRDDKSAATFSAPGGYTISGLTLDQAIGLLRLFG